jgi:hypothetical protein
LAEAPPNTWACLFCFLPDDVFVIAPVDERIHVPGAVVVEENAAFDSFAEKEVGCFGQELFLLAVAFDE